MNIEEIKNELIPIAAAADWIGTAANNALNQISLYQDGYTDSRALVTALLNIVDRINDFATYQENIRKLTLNDHLRAIINHIEGAK